VLLAWLSIFVVIPSCSISLLRYRLWQLRDKLAGEIRAGKFSDQDQPQRLILVIEASIKSAHVYSLPNMLLLHLFVRKVELPTPFDLDALNADDRRLFERRLEQLEMDTLSRALIGTPSGWVVLMLAVPVALLVTGYKALLGKRYGVEEWSHRAKARLRREIDIDATSVLIRAESRDPRPAYQFM
jgi:hypothetical protein